MIIVASSARTTDFTSLGRRLWRECMAEEALSILIRKEKEGEEVGIPFSSPNSQPQQPDDFSLATCA